MSERYTDFFLRSTPLPGLDLYYVFSPQDFQTSADP